MLNLLILRLLLTHLQLHLLILDPFEVVEVALIVNQLLVEEVDDLLDGRV
jgi:hypothetical protein